MSFLKEVILQVGYICMKGKHIRYRPNLLSIKKRGCTSFQFLCQRAPLCLTFVPFIRQPFWFPFLPSLELKYNRAVFKRKKSDLFEKIYVGSVESWPAIVIVNQLHTIKAHKCDSPIILRLQYVSQFFLTSPLLISRHNESESECNCFVFLALFVGKQ